MISSDTTGAEMDPQQQSHAPSTSVRRGPSPASIQRRAQSQGPPVRQKPQPEGFPLPPGVAELIGDTLKAQLAQENMPDEVEIAETYQLPRRPKDVYHNQARPFMTMKGGNVMPAMASDAEPTFGKLIDRLSHKDRIGQVAGPWAAPSEPLWGELGQNLTKILNKAGKRMARRRRRRLQTKLFSSRAPPRRLNARGIREVIDKPLDPGVPPNMDGVEHAMWGKTS